MGKILDTITVFFKGNTDDLKRKKKEAEDLSAEAAKNIKATTTQTNATNASLDTTNKTLIETQTLTNEIGQGISGWVLAAQEAANAINAALASEKARREEKKREDALKATKKGANEVEKALKNVAGQFASVALGALTVGSLVNQTKDFVGTVTDLAQASRNFEIPIQKLYGYRQATKETNGDVQDFIGTLENLRSQYNLTGDALVRLHNEAAKQIVDVGAIDKAAARVVGANFGFTQGEINYLLSNPQALANIDAQTSAIDKTKDKVLELNSAWSRLTNEIGDETLTAINALAPAITKALDATTVYLKRGGLLTAWRYLDTDLERQTHEDDERIRSQIVNRGTSYPLHVESAYDPSHYGLPVGSASNPSNNRNVAISVNEITINSPEQVNAEVLMREIQNVVHVPAAEHIINYYNDGRIA